MAWRCEQFLDLRDDPGSVDPGVDALYKGVPYDTISLFGTQISRCVSRRH